MVGLFCVDILSQFAFLLVLSPLFKISDKSEESIHVSVFQSFHNLPTCRSIWCVSNNMALNFKWHLLDHLCNHKLVYNLIFHAQPGTTYLDLLVIIFCLTVIYSSAYFCLISKYLC